MSPALDIKTLVLIHVSVNIGLAVVLLYLWSVQRNYPPARDWALGALMSAVGLFLFSLRNQAPVVLTEVAADLFLLPGTMLFNFGIVKATGRQPPFAWGLALCVVANGILAWFTLARPNYDACVLAQNTVFLMLDAYTAWACLGAKTAKGNHTFRIIGALFVVLVLAILWRVAGGVFGLTFSFSPTLPRLFWIATSLISLPMITVLLTLHTSQRLQEEIHAQAHHDTLTEAFNRRAFAEFAETQWNWRRRQGDPLSILMVDIDHFKDFNDHHGHQIGDLALVQMSKSAQATLRSADLWCRYGGEEFVALLSGTAMEQAMAVAERLRRSVESATITTPRGPLNVSVSIGVAERLPQHASLADLLAAADAALYKAKAEGRNRVVADASGQACQPEGE